MRSDPNPKPGETQPGNTPQPGQGDEDTKV